MDENRANFWNWVKAHKKQLALAGFTIAVIVGVVCGLKKKDDLIALWESLAERIGKVSGKTPALCTTAQPPITMPELVAVPRPYTPPQSPYEVGFHIRTMTNGRRHSAAKAAEAAALNIELQPYQTIVDPYIKNKAAQLVA